MLKRFTAIVITFVFVASLIACSKSNNSSPSNSAAPGNANTQSNQNTASDNGVDKSAKVKITLNTHFTDEARRNLLNEAIDKLKQTWPNLEVLDETGTDNTTKMKLEFSSGSGPDFVTVDDLMQQTLMQGGYLKDITEMVTTNGYINKSVPGAVEFNNLRTPGKYYSVPFLMAPVVIYYNKDIFTKLNVSAPKTVEDFEAIMEKAKQEGYMPMADAGSDNMNIMWLVYHLVFTNASMDDIRKWYYQEETPVSVKDAFVNALAKIDEWTKKGYFGEPKIAMGIKYDNYIANMYAKGTVAMVMDGDWNISAFTDSGVNTGIFSFPSEYIVNATDSGWALNANADETKTAVFQDFVNIFYSDEMISKYYTSGYTPSVKFDTSGLEVNPLKAELQNAVADKKLGYFLDNAVPGYYDVVQKTTQDLMLGQLTPEQSWKQLEQGYEQGKTQQAGK